MIKYTCSFGFPCTWDDYHPVNKNMPGFTIISRLENEYAKMVDEEGWLENANWYNSIIDDDEINEEEAKQVIAAILKVDPETIYFITEGQLNGI